MPCTENKSPQNKIKQMRRIRWRYAMSEKKETAKQIKTNPRTTWRYATKEEQKISQKTMPKSLVSQYCCDWIFGCFDTSTNSVHRFAQWPIWLLSVAEAQIRLFTLFYLRNLKPSLKIFTTKNLHTTWRYATKEKQKISQKNVQFFLQSWFSRHII